MKTLVIGSSGFIGSHLVPELTQRGHQVTGMDRRPAPGEMPPGQFIAGDLHRLEDLLPALEDVELVVHLAAVHADFGHAEHEYWDTNEGGTQTLLDAMSQAQVKRLVFTSSIAVYGEREDEASEATPPAPTSPYGASKLAGEQRIRQWAAADPERCVAILRPCVVYGERNVANMYNLIRQIQSRCFVLFGSGRNIKATAYVGNVVAALVWLAERLEPGVVLYNYADKPDLQVRQIVAIIRQAMGRSPRAWALPLWAGTLAAVPFELASRLTGKNLPVSRARVKKLAQPTLIAAQAIRDAGYQQQVASEEGLRRMVRYVLENGK